MEEHIQGLPAISPVLEPVTGKMLGVKQTMRFLEGCRQKAPPGMLHGCALRQTPCAAVLQCRHRGCSQQGVGQIFADLGTRALPAAAVAEARACRWGQGLLRVHIVPCHRGDAAEVIGACVQDCPPARLCPNTPCRRTTVWTLTYPLLRLIQKLCGPAEGDPQRVPACSSTPYSSPAQLPISLSSGFRPLSDKTLPE